MGLKKVEGVKDLGKEHFNWKAYCEREKNFFYIREEFVPNVKAESVTGKFWARHEAQEGIVPDPYNVKLIEDALAKGPKDKNDEPETENQRYGWYTELLVPRDKSDRIINHPRFYTQLTTVAAEIYMATKDVPKEKPFVGTPFKL